ncbi:calcium-binding protein [Shinella sp. CPCC 101442]|uniref:calcium-binding protein n=1 Tax=Shinella sp. CPCC 101442 TaxID=2932265 RepID=UPI002152D7E0|nr:calcium-binding protein [Shinella sp. CPCC 101442]MCR6499224.1 calcium-binding protein [Shinella sp. CPCC 101442]
MARTITGTAGADRIVQGGNINNTELTIRALGGNDTIILNRSDDFGGRNFVNASSGNDSVVNVKEDGNLILLGSGKDTYVGTGFASFSNERADLIKAGAGNDKIVVSTFKSTYLGESGNDRFFSVGQQNTFNGGKGVDSISYLPRDDDNVVGGSGVGIDLQQGIAQTGANRFEQLISIERAEGTNADDVIFGSRVANVLKGLGGDDALAGRAGNDVLVGGRGTDLLQGDAGADRFDFNSRLESVRGDGRDVILDFNHGERDRIDLRDIDAISGQTGNQAFSFIGANAFSEKAGELRFKNGIVSGDTNGDGRADLEIEIRGVDSLLKGDFLL